MSCRFDKTSFLKNGADEVGQECADQDQNKQKGYITLISSFFHVMHVPIYERPAKDSDDVIKHHDVVARASQQDKDMEDLMFTPAIGDLNMQSVDDAADRIEKATGQKPEETDLSQGQIDRLDP